MSLAENYLEESLQEFSTGLNSSLPIRHHCEYYDNETIQKVIKLESHKVLQKLRGKISVFKNRQKKRDLEKEFHSGIERITEEYASRNEDCKRKSEEFLKELVKDVCKYFKSTSEAQILLAPDMDLKRVETLLETGKEVAIQYFDYHSNYGYVGLYENQKHELGQKLDIVGIAMIEQHRLHLKNKAEEETRKSTEELKQVVVDMLKQVPSNLSKRIRLRKIADIQKYLMENGGKLMVGNYGEIYSELFKFEAEGCLPAEDITRWAAGLHMEVQTGIENVENERETHDLLFVQEPVSTLEVTGSNEFAEGMIKEETFELDADLDLHHEMDIEVKIEGLVVQKSCLKPDFIVHRTHDPNLDDDGNVCSGEKDVRIFKRPKISETRTAEQQEEILFEMTRDLLVSNNTNEGQPLESDNDGPEYREQKVLTDQPKIPIKTVTPRRSKRCRQMIPKQASLQIEDKTFVDNIVELNEASSSTKERKLQREIRLKNRSELLGPKEVNDVKLNIPDKTGDFPLLRAIRSKKNLIFIQNMLDGGADVNVSKGKNSTFTAAHEAIKSLIYKQRTQSCALSILNLLVGKGFNRINAANSTGETPLSYAMRVKDLDEEFLNWFYKNGADFNNQDACYGESVLFSAIRFRQEEQIIRKILEYGGDPKFVDRRGRNALHKAAWYAHESALEMMIGHLNVNDVDEDNCNPLHYLFRKGNLDYQSCLEILLQNEADFGMISKDGHVPLVRWMLSHPDPFPTLMKVKDKLPLTLEIASAALTAMVGCDWFRVRKNEFSASFAQFFRFLMEEKDAKIRLTKDEKWFITKRFKEYILTREFSTELRLRIGNQMDWEGDFVRYEASELGKVNLHTESGSVTVAIETVLVCLLACAKDEDDRENFVDLCRFLGRFCDYTLSH